MEQMRKRRAEQDPTVAMLPSKKRSRPSLLGANLDKKVQVSIRKVREGQGWIQNCGRGVQKSAEAAKQPKFFRVKHGLEYTCT